MRKLSSVSFHNLFKILHLKWNLIFLISEPKFVIIKSVLFSMDHRVAGTNNAESYGLKSQKFFHYFRFIFLVA